MSITTKQFNADFNVQNDEEIDEFIDNIDRWYVLFIEKLMLTSL